LETWQVIAWGSALSYIPVVAGIAWVVFALGHWSRPQSELFATSGFLIGAAASSVLFLPVLRLRAPTRKFLGLSVSQYTLISVAMGVLLAAMLAMTAITLR
jgi:O-antigen ligase